MIDDNALIRAARKRILRELAGQQGSQGSDTHHAAAGGIMDRMGGAPSGDNDLFEYLVDISKKDEIDPTTGKSVGWTKHVKRSRIPKGE